MTRIKAWWYGLPLSVRKAATDFWTVFVSGAGLIVVASFANGFPSDRQAWTEWALTIGAALANVAVNAARRAWETDLT